MSAVWTRAVYLDGAGVAPDLVEDIAESAAVIDRIAGVLTQHPIAKFGVHALSSMPDEERALLHQLAASRGISFDRLFER